MKELFLLARRHEAINNWLGQNPVVLGAIFLAIGVVLGGWGLRELTTGVAHGKYGKAVTGFEAKALAVVRIVGGAGCILFGLFKIVFG